MFILRDAMVPSKCCQMYISEYLSSCKGVSPSITAPCLFIWVPYYVLWPPHCSAFLRRFSMVFNLWEAMVLNKCCQTCISEYPSSRKRASASIWVPCLFFRVPYYVLWSPQLFVFQYGIYSMGAVVPNRCCQTCISEYRPSCKGMRLERLLAPWSSVKNILQTCV